MIDEENSTIFLKEKGMKIGLGYDKMTLDEIAEKMKKPRARIQQIKEKGIRHLRERTKSKTLKQFLENL